MTEIEVELADIVFDQLINEAVSEIVRVWINFYFSNIYIFYFMYLPRIK